MHPGGISDALSCTRTRCQSTKREWSWRSDHSERLTQVGFLHLTGVVYLNCCATGSDSVWHRSHWKTPTSSSGRTSVVRVTVAEKAVRHATLSVRSSRMQQRWGRLKKETWKSRSAAYASCSCAITFDTDTRRCGSR